MLYQSKIKQGAIFTDLKTGEICSAKETAQVAVYLVRFIKGTNYFYFISKNRKYRTTSDSWHNNYVAGDKVKHKHKKTQGTVIGCLSNSEGRYGPVCIVDFGGPDPMIIHEARLIKIRP